MKKLLCGVVLTSVAMGASAETWVPVATSGGGTTKISIERDSIKRSGTTVLAWMRTDFPTMQGLQGPYNRRVEHMKLDCFGDTYVSSSFQVFRDDTLIATVPTNGPLDIRPGTVMSGVEKALCPAS
jgi:hypothetical protein